MAGTAVPIVMASVSGGNFIPETGLTLHLRVTPYSSNTYTATEIGNGKYRFDNVEAGLYKLYSDTTEQTAWGARWIGDEDMSNIFLVLTGGTMSGAIAMGSNKITGLAAGTTTGDAVRYEQVVRTTGTQTGLTAVIGWQGIHSWTGVVPTCNTTPTTGFQLTNKDYVDAAVSGVAINPYQESAYYRRVIVDGTEETNKVYKTIAAAITSLTTPTAIKQALIEIIDMGGSSEFITLDHNSLLDYITIRQKNKGYYSAGVNDIQGIVLGVNTASVTKKVQFDNCVLYMGVNDITTARTYNSVTFKDCIIYAYHDTTFTNCILDNTRVYHPSGKAGALAGSTRILGQVNFNQALTSIAGTVLLDGHLTDESDTGFSLPTDPSVAV